MSFKVFTIGDRIRVTDATEHQIAYVRKKSFRLKEDVKVYTDEEQKETIYRIKTDQVLDFGATYKITFPDGRPVGAIRRKGMKSLWRSTYDVLDTNGTKAGIIREENP